MLGFGLMPPGRQWLPNDPNVKRRTVAATPSIREKPLVL
jgi:hypothetical protein